LALQKILGHSTLSMTQRYVRLYAEDLKEDYEDFSALDVIKKKSRRTSQFKK
jgi:site-specific recombinase XerD